MQNHTSTDNSELNEIPTNNTPDNNLSELEKTREQRMKEKLSLNVKRTIKKLRSKDEEQGNKNWWPKEENLKGPTQTQTAEEFKNSLSGTEKTEYKKGRLSLNPKKKRYPDFELNCLSMDEHNVLWDITNEMLSESKKELEKINQRINFQENLLDPGNIEEEEKYLEEMRWMLRQEMKELKKYLNQPGMLESLTQLESEVDEKG